MVLCTYRTLTDFKGSVARCRRLLVRSLLFTGAHCEREKMADHAVRSLNSTVYIGYVQYYCSDVVYVYETNLIIIHFIFIAEYLKYTVLRIVTYSYYLFVYSVLPD